MANTLKAFSVVDQATGIQGIAQFSNEIDCLEITIQLDNGHRVISHQDYITADFHVPSVIFIDAKAEKALYDAGLLE